MAKLTDKFALVLCLFFILLAIASFIFDTITSILIFVFASTAIVLIIIYAYSKNHKKPYSVDRLTLEIIMRGNSYAVGLLKSVNPNIESNNNCIVFDNFLFVSSIKQSALGTTDFIGLAKLAREYERDKVYVLTTKVDRKAYQILTYEKIDVEIVKMKTFFKVLKSMNALPNLKVKKERAKLGEIAKLALKKSNAKHYLLSGALLISVSFLTPLKIYYLTVGSILLCFAILALSPLGSGNLTHKSQLKTLQDSIKNNDHNQNVD